MPIDTTVPAGSTAGTSGTTDTGGSTGTTEGGTGAEVFGDGATEAASTTSTAPADATSGTSEIPEGDDGSWDDFSNIFGDDAEPVADTDSGSTIPDTTEEAAETTKETQTKTNTNSDHSNRLASLINKPLSLPKANDFFNNLFDKMQEAFDKLKEKGGKEAKEDAKKTLKETLNNANIFKGKLLGELDKAAKEGKSSVVEAYQEMLQQIEDMRASILENMRLDLGDGAKKAFNEAKEVAKNLGNLLAGEKNAKGETLQGQPKPTNAGGTKLGYKSPGSKAENSTPLADVSVAETADELAKQAETKKGKDLKSPEFMKVVADKVAQLVGSKEAEEKKKKWDKFNDLRKKLGSITQGILNHAKAAQGAASDMLKGVVLSLQTQAFNGVMSGMVSGGLQVFGHASQGLEEEGEAYTLLAQLGVINPKNQTSKAQKTEAPLPSNPDEWDGVNATMNNKYRIAWNARDFLPDFEKPLEGDEFITVGQEAIVKDLESMPV